MKHWLGDWFDDQAYGPLPTEAFETADEVMKAYLDAVSTFGLADRASVRYMNILPTGSDDKFDARYRRARKREMRVEAWRHRRRNDDVPWWKRLVIAPRWSKRRLS